MAGFAILILSILSVTQLTYAQQLVRGCVLLHVYLRAK